jgi:hypothetical protein
MVLGMHRSGTSLIAKAVSVLGVALGDNLWGPREDNPTGFWEDRDVVALDKELLDRAGMTWSSLAPRERSWTGADFADLKEEALGLLRERLSHHGSWVFKDPRASRVLPFWKDVFAGLGVRPSYILTVRHPSDVASSLRRRDGLPGLHSHLLWLAHVCGALADTAGEPRCFVDYDELVEQPAAELQRLARALHLPVTPEIESAISGFASGFVTRELRHHSGAADAGEAGSPEAATRLHALLRDVALGRRGEEALAPAAGEAERELRAWAPACDALDDAEGRLAAARDVIVERDYWTTELRGQIARLTAEKAEAEELVREHGARLQDFYKEIEALRGEVETLREEKADLERLVREHGARLQDFYKEIEALRQAKAALEDSLKEHREQLDQAQAELARIKRHWYWRVARLIIR